MADQSMLMNSEQPENGIGFPMQSANNMAFTNGQDMQQGKMLPNVNPFGYPMFGVGAPGDMSTAHLSNPGSQMLQGSGTAAGAGGSGVGGAGAPNAWPTGMGQQSMMMPQQHGGQAVPPFMMNRPSFPPPVGPMHMPPNMPGGIMPSANPQMNPSIGPMGMGSFPNFPAWPNGPQPHDPTTWGQSSTVGSNSPALKAAGMGLPPAASGNAMGASNSTMPTPSLPDLGGDVGLPPTEDKSRPSTAESGVRVNGEIPGTPAAAGHQGLPSHFNAMMTPGAQPSVGATTAAAAGGGGDGGGDDNGSEHSSSGPGTNWGSYLWYGLAGVAVVVPASVLLYGVASSLWPGAFRGGMKVTQNLSLLSWLTLSQSLEIKSPAPPDGGSGT
eukprot:scpid12257/ scgid12137/ 